MRRHLCQPRVLCSAAPQLRAGPCRTGGATGQLVYVWQQTGDGSGSNVPQATDIVRRAFALMVH